MIPSKLQLEGAAMARTSGTDDIADIAAIKTEEMQQVADIILMAQAAKPTELLAVKAGLDKAFGDAWRRFNLVKGLPLSRKI